MNIQKMIEDLTEEWLLVNNAIVSLEKFKTLRHGDPKKRDRPRMALDKRKNDPRAELQKRLMLRAADKLNL